MRYQRRNSHLRENMLWRNKQIRTGIKDNTLDGIFPVLSYIAFQNQEISGQLLSISEDLKKVNKILRLLKKVYIYTGVRALKQVLLESNTLSILLGQTQNVYYFLLLILS